MVKKTTVQNEDRFNKFITKFILELSIWSMALYIVPFMWTVIRT